MRKLHKLAAVLAAATVPLALAATPARAHDVWVADWTYRTDNSDCTFVRSMISHGQDVTISEVDVTSEIAGEVPCGRFFGRPAGEVTGMAQLLKWIPDVSQWATCEQTDWQYSQSDLEFQVIVDEEWGGTAPCQPGYYGTFGWGYQWSYDTDQTGSWHGGGVWSGYHWLPDTGFAKVPAARPPAPGDRVAVIGPDGTLLRDGTGQPVTRRMAPPPPPARAR